MFGNRGYGWKLAGALAAMALLGVRGAKLGERINPAIPRCVAQPERWDRSDVWVPAGRVISVREAEYDLEVSSARIRVSGRSPATPGEWVSVAGTFRADGPRIEARRVRVLPPHARLRWLVEVVSVAVLLGVLVNFARHFRFRPEALQIRRAG